MIDKDTLDTERMKLQADFEATQERIREYEQQLVSLRNNLNALHGAIQQTDKLLKLVDEKKEEKSGKVVQNHSKDRELDEFEEDLTRGKNLEEKAPDTSDAMKRYKSGKAGFTDIAHLKAKGLIPRADGEKKKSDKYK